MRRLVVSAALCEALAGLFIRSSSLGRRTGEHAERFTRERVPRWPKPRERSGTRPATTLAAARR